MGYEYKTRGVCARKITVDLEGNIVKKVAFQGGCDGNLKAVAALVEGLPIDVVAAKLAGMTCGGKPTSCPDQLVIALKEAYKQAKNK